MRNARDQGNDGSERITAEQQSKRMPGAIEEKDTIADESSHDRLGGRKIRERQPFHARGDELPDGRGQNCRADYRTHLAHPTPQRQGKYLADRQDDAEAAH